MPLAFSYRRFSSPQQAKGDSAARQEETIAAYCAQHNLTLDQRTFDDFGRSAFAIRKQKGGRRLKVRTAQDSLQAFLDLLEAGDIPKGSKLIVENLDRLTREKESEALQLMLEIINSDITIVTISPSVQEFNADNLDMTRLIIALADLSRGHRFSLSLSDRLGKWWAKTRDTKRMIPRCPAWIKRTKDGFELDKTKQKTIELIYKLCNQGLGTQQILRRLLRDNVPRISKKGWSKSYIDVILKDRNIIGEYQPHIGKAYDRKPVGEAIPNYYPAAISEAVFNKAQANRASRRKSGGRPAKTINVFGGLLVDNKTGSKVYRQGEWLVVSSYLTGDTDECVKFPADFVERSLLSMIVSVPASELTSETESLLPALQDELLVCEGNIKLLEQRMAKGKKFESLLNLLVKEEENRERLTAAIQEERTKQPLAQIYADFIGAVNFLKGLEGEALCEAKQNLQAIVKRTIRDIKISFCTMGYDRGFACEVTFTSNTSVKLYGARKYARRGNTEECGFITGKKPLAELAREVIESLRAKIA